MEKRCKAYMGTACVDGSCPIANAGRYEKFSMDVISKCNDCFYYGGCKDCALDGTEYCDKVKFRRLIVWGLKMHGKNSA